MIEFFLPNLYGYKFKINEYFIKLIKQHNEYFYDKVAITCCFGHFNNCIWDGGRENKNITNFNLLKCKEQIEKINSLGISARFVFTNSLIKEEHLNDQIGNFLMRVGNNGMNGAIVASDILFKYLKENYQNYHYVYSTTLCNQNIDKYNSLSNEFDILVLDYRSNHNSEFLSNINNKNKIEILLDDCCPECVYRKQHFENISRYNLGEKLDISCMNKNNFTNSQHNKNFFENLVINHKTTCTYEYMQELISNGFNKFKLTGRSQGPRFIIESYLYYMIKPKYWIQIKEELQKILNIPLFDLKN